MRNALSAPLTARTRAFRRFAEPGHWGQGLALTGGLLSGHDPTGEEPSRDHAAGR